MQNVRKCHAEGVKRPKNLGVEENKEVKRVRPTSTEILRFAQDDSVRVLYFAAGAAAGSALAGGSAALTGVSASLSMEVAMK
jgi:hypothetical protein